MNYSTSEICRQFTARCLLVAFHSFLILGQVSAQFTTIINLPPDPNIGDNQSIGSNTQLNVADGGSIGVNFRAGSSTGLNTNIEVNITGGHVEGGFFAYNGSTVNISGGIIDYRIVGHEGSSINISGGTIGGLFTYLGGSLDITGGLIGFFRPNDESEVNIYAGDIRVDGVLLPGLENLGDSLDYHLPRGSILSGVLADGTSFIFDHQDNDGVEDGVVTLNTIALPAVGPLLINLPSDPAPLAIRDGQTLNVGVGGSVGDYFIAGRNSTLNLTSAGQIGWHAKAIGANVNISNGSVDKYFEAHVGSTINITGGSIDDSFQAKNGSTLNISGGVIGDFFRTSGGSITSITGGTIGNEFFAGSGSIVNISGGSIGEDFNASGDSVNITGGNIDDNFVAWYHSTVDISGGTIGDFARAYHDSVVNLSGGSIGKNFYAESESTVNISGGVIGDRFRSFTDTMVSITGGDFRIDGVPISGLENIGDSIQYNMPLGASTLSGTLSNGTPFAFSTYDHDSFADGTLTLSRTALPPVGPSLINLPSDPAPQGIRQGQTLVVNNGANIGDHFNAGIGSALIVSGGIVGDNFELVNAQLTLENGSIGSDFDAFHGAEIHISGGTIGNYGQAISTIINLSDGLIGGNFSIGENSTANVSGGLISSGLSLNVSKLNLSGGVIDGYTSAFQSEINISNGSFGTNLTTRNSIVNLTGGSIGQDFEAMLLSTINISGGFIDAQFTSRSNSIVNLYGGTIGDNYHSLNECETNIFGTQFFLDGIDITNSLTTNIPFTVADRDVTLSGLLADGSPFSFDLNSTFSNSTDYFDPTAFLNITLVQPGDFDGNLNVDGADFLNWQRGLADPFNQDDLANWENNFGFSPASVVTVPEPNTPLLLFTGLAFTFLLRNNRHL